MSAPPVTPPTPAAEALLATHGYAAAARRPLPGDAGARAYARLEGGPRPALLVRDPGGGLPGFLALAAHLRAHGLAAPAVLGADPAAGLALVEDLGVATMADRLDAGADPVPLYAAAGRALAALHAVPPPPGLPAWDAGTMAAATAATFLDWWWPEAFGAPAPATARDALDAALRTMLAPFAGADVLVHRDFFPANLVPRPGRPAPGDVGVLDFQDAGTGHPAYDLVSLVEDARRDVAPAARAAALEAYRAARPGPDAEPLAAAMAAHGAQRHLRVAALWVRLARRDGKPRYLAHGPRCWAHLARSLEHPAAAPLAAFLDRFVPPARRANPPPPQEAA